MRKILLLIGIFMFITTFTYGQNINLDEYDIFVSDTLISKSDFIKNSQNLPPEKAQTIEFKPITDGNKIYYYLNGQVEGKGEIKDGLQVGNWEFWHSNGVKAREGEFKKGKPNGIHKYWYENGNLRGIGNWKNGNYDGKWEMYSEDGKEKIEQKYKDGKLIEK